MADWRHCFEIYTQRNLTGRIKWIIYILYIYNQIRGRENDVKRLEKLNNFRFLTHPRENYNWKSYKYFFISKITENVFYLIWGIMNIFVFLQNIGTLNGTRLDERVDFFLFILCLRLYLENLFLQLTIGLSADHHTLS